MPYLIDGHNLIPKLGCGWIPWMMKRNSSYDCRNSAVCVVSTRRSFSIAHLRGRLRGVSRLSNSHFVRQGSSADAAIELQLARMGKTVKNWKVISSDGRVQRAARAVHAGVLSSEEFAREMSDPHVSRVAMLKTKPLLPRASWKSGWMFLIKRKIERSLRIAPAPSAIIQKL